VGQLKPVNRIKAVVDLACLDDTLPLICFENHVPFVGVTFNEFHTKALKLRIAQKIFKLKCTFAGGKNPWYDPGLANLLQIGNAAASSGATSSQPNTVQAAAAQAAQAAVDTLAASTTAASSGGGDGAGGPDTKRRKTALRDNMIQALKGGAVAEPADTA